MAVADQSSNRVTDQADLSALIDRIRKRLHLFDPLSLLRVLKQGGVDVGELHFRSHMSSASQPRLVEDLILDSGVITIIFNFGLLSAQSPLPSYFFQEIDEGRIDVHEFQALMGLYDHALIKLYLQCIYPELNDYLFPNWSRSVQRRVRIQNLRNISGVHWIFTETFPDLRVCVEKKQMEREVRLSGLKLGYFVLGDDAMFGQKTANTVLGIRVSLYVDDELDGCGTPWFQTVRKRFEEHISPILSAVGVDLELTLIFTDRVAELGLDDSSYLGYDRMRGGENDSHEVIIFQGQLCS